jgi:hypothetical protein
MWNTVVFFKSPPDGVIVLSFLCAVWGYFKPQKPYLLICEKYLPWAFLTCEKYLPQNLDLGEVPTTEPCWSVEKYLPTHQPFW